MRRKEEEVVRVMRVLDAEGKKCRGRSKLNVRIDVIESDTS